MSVGPTHPAPRPLGRHPASRALIASMPRVPRIFRGAIPRKQLALAKFVRRQKWYQVRGFCPGWSLAKCQTTVMQIPFNLDDSGSITPAAWDSQPRDIASPASPLFAYDISRMEAAAEGINLGNDPGENGDGSIVSCALKGCEKWGVATWAEYPSDPQYEQPHANNTRPPASVMKAASDNPCVIGLHDTLDHGLETLGAGIPLNVGCPIGNNFLNPDAKGRISSILGGGIVGGHAWTIAGYDLDAGWALAANSWPQWGISCDDPVWKAVFGFEFSPAESAAMGGFSNMAFIGIDDLRRVFTPSRMRSGECEIGAVHVVKGFDPLIVDVGGWRIPG